MSIGSPAIKPGVLFPTDRDSVQESEEDRQRRLLQNEPIVVYTSLSELRVLVPEIAWRGVVLLLILAVQVVCIVVIFTGSVGSEFFDTGEPLPNTAQMGIYCSQLGLHIFFLLSMYLWNIDMLKVYSVGVTLIFFLVLILAFRSMFDT